MLCFLPFFIRKMLQAPYHCRGPLLDSFQEIPGFSVPRNPEMDIGYQKSRRWGTRPAWLTRGLPVELRHKKKWYGCWKHGQAMWNRDAVHVCREKMHSAKAWSFKELKLATSVGDNKKFSFKYVNRKRRTGENIYPLLDGEGHLTDKDIGKAEMFNAYFSSVFNAEGGFQDPWVL